MEVDFNFEFSLEVEERSGKKLIGSECKPYKIAHTQKDDVWDNGPTAYCRTDNSEYWMIIQNGQPMIIEKYYQTGDWIESGSTGWNAYKCSVLPNGTGIVREEVI